jgi:Ser/Thr protein kinase RdoA (MazF antagonist)
MPPSATDPAAVASALLGMRVDAVEARRGGGNNRVFRVRAGARSYALKGYPTTVDDPRDRLGHEFGGLTFLRRGGVTAVPEPLAADPVAGFALYDWIEGTPVSSHDATDIENAVSFLAQLDELSGDPAAAALPAAAEAVFRPAELDAQIAFRLERLAALPGDEPALRRLVPEIRAILRTLDRPDEAPVPRRTLSPSDFGFHNALRRPDGDLVFLDFEYFGWDDPVKLVCDVWWHPGMALGVADRELFVRLARPVYAADREWDERFARDLPRYGLRWALIVLNEFVPGVWERRRAAGAGLDWTAAKAAQAAKAEALVERVRALADRRLR